jgi:hypothetical protein
MDKRNVLYVFIFLLLTSCLDQEESNYNLIYESYKVEGVYIKDCEGEPVSGSTLRLYAFTNDGPSKLILAQTSTDSDGFFSTSYSLETTTFRKNYSDLLIYSYDESTQIEQLVSNRLPWQKDIFVDLIQNIEDSIYFYTEGLNQLSNSDTLFIKEQSTSNNRFSKYFIGPFPDGRLLDSIQQPFTNYNSINFKWYISDTCKYNANTPLQLKCNAGNYGEIENVVPYCERLNVSINLSNAVN